jgi:putative endopeptidase
MHTHRLTGLVAGAAFAALTALAPHTALAQDTAAPHGVNQTSMDPAVKPGDNFFAFANGTWIAQTTIPNDRSSYGVGASMVEITDKRVADLIKAAGANDPARGSEARKIADFYATYMDDERIEALGLAPVRPELTAIAEVRSRRALARALSGTLRADVDILNNTALHTERLFGLWVAQDLDDPKSYSPFLVQGGLGLPDRDYYLAASPRMEDIRVKYRAHIAAVLKLAGFPNAEARAAAIFDLEHKIALTHVSRSDAEDVEKGDNHWTRADFAARAPGLDWTGYFAAAGLGAQRNFVVWEPSAATGISALAAHEPLAVWRDYMAFHALERASAVLPAAFVDERFAFYGKVLSGTPSNSVRWKRAVGATNVALGEAVGKLYAERYFPPEAKAQVQAMVKNLLTAFSRRIDSLEWMAPATKAKAQAKLATLKVGVGYPDHWRDYSGLRVVSGDAYGNASRASLFEYKRNLNKLGHAIDRGEWVMTPQTVNAVNLPAMNALNFPAAELQAPDFDPNAAAAVNYGAVGAIIGHEISHSFDDQGALFDSTGRLANWWTPSDFAHFRASAEQLVKEFDGYRPFPDISVNGRQTLSENIADVAGLAAAYDAYHLSLGGAPAPMIDGLSGDQQFFLAFAQNWRTKVREAALRQQVLTDGHAPAEYRSETVRNNDAWYTAFDVKPGQTLYLAPADRVRMW